MALAHPQGCIWVVLVRLALGLCNSYSTRGDWKLKVRDGHWYELNTPSIFRLHWEQCSSSTS